MLVSAKERQWFHDPHSLLIHPESQTDSFTLMVKASVLLSKVKNFNIRYRARYFAKDPDYIPTIAAPARLPGSDVLDPRSTPAFMEVENLVSNFRGSFPPDMRNPISGNVVDVHLFTACTIPHVYEKFPNPSYLLHYSNVMFGSAMIVLHEPHAVLEVTGCISATNVLVAARQMLTLIYSVWSTSFDLALLDVFIAVRWVFVALTHRRC